MPQFTEQSTFTPKTTTYGPYQQPESKALDYKKHYLSTRDETQLKQNFLDWSQEKTYILFEQISTGRIFSVPVARRGNDRYRWRILNKWHNLKDYTRMLQRLCGRNESGVLFVTLTYDPKKLSQDCAWRRIGKDFNNFMSRMRKDYGKMVAIRCFQPHKSGYPHVHAILFFRHQKFRMKKMSKKFRLSTYPTKLKSHWIHGFSDWSCVQVLERAMRYIMRYLSKGLKTDDLYLLGLAKMWVFNIRAFSISTSISRLDISSIIKNEEARVRFIGIIKCPFDLNKTEILHLTWEYDYDERAYMAYIRVKLHLSEY